jgi:hypothetical protein
MTVAQKAAGFRGFWSRAIGRDGRSRKLNLTKEKTMTDATANTKPAAISKIPSHYVYHVIPVKGQESFYRRIGSAWSQADGKGFNVQLESLPLDGRVQLRVPMDRKE